MRQFVVENEKTDSNNCLIIEGKKFKYLNSVLRVQAGDMIQVRLANGILQPMTVCKIDTSAKKILLQNAGSDESSKPEFSCKIPETEYYLFQFIPKSPKLDLIVRQACECGVKNIILVDGEFCQKGNVESAKKRCCSSDERFARIITEAREQSGSPVETNVLGIMSVDEACSFWKKESEGSGSIGIVMYECTAGTVAVKDAVCGDGIKKVALVVGAEGGISKAEVEALSSAGFTPVHFETNILRCETASLYGTAALQVLLSGEKNGSEKN